MKSGAAYCFAYNRFLVFLRIFLFAGEDNIRYYSEDKSGGYFGKGYLSEFQRHSADTANENNRGGKEVFIFIKVYGLVHFKSADSDKAVKRYADAAHNAGGNG